MIRSDRNGFHPSGWKRGDLEQGFPVKTLHLTDVCFCGYAVLAVVGNIDKEPTVEIVVTGVADGPIYAWNSDGTSVSGWPLDYYEDGYIAMGNLAGSNSQLELFIGYFGGQLEARSGSGAHLPVWPKTSANGTSVPSLVDLDGDGMDVLLAHFSIVRYPALIQGTAKPLQELDGQFRGQSTDCISQTTFP